MKLAKIERESALRENIRELWVKCWGRNFNLNYRLGSRFKNVAENKMRRSIALFEKLVVPHYFKYISVMRGDFGEGGLSQFELNLSDSRWVTQMEN